MPEKQTPHRPANILPVQNMSPMDDIHDAAFSEVTPVVMAPSLAGVSPELRTAITDERREKSRKATHDLVTILQKNHQLERAMIDGATGVFNRAAFDEDYPSLFQRRPAGALALQYIDLNGLKRANYLGHDKGDQYLEAVAQTIRDRLRPTDMIYRVGGDELVVLFDGVIPPEKLEEIKNRFKKASDKAVTALPWSEGLFLGISVGSAIKQEGDTPLKLTTRADLESEADKEQFYADIERRTGKNLRR